MTCSFPRAVCGIVSSQQRLTATQAHMRLCVPTLEENTDALGFNVPAVVLKKASCKRLIRCGRIAARATPILQPWRCLQWPVPVLARWMQPCAISIFSRGKASLILFPSRTLCASRPPRMLFRRRTRCRPARSGAWQWLLCQDGKNLHVLRMRDVTHELGLRCSEDSACASFC